MLFDNPTNVNFYIYIFDHLPSGLSILVNPRWWYTRSSVTQRVAIPCCLPRALPGVLF